MNIPNSIDRRRRFPREVIAHAVFVYHRFALSLRDVEDLLAERGVTVSYETIRVWCAHFGPKFASRLRKRQRTGGDHWYLDEMLSLLKIISSCGDPRIPVMQTA